MYSLHVDACIHLHDIVGDILTSDRTSILATVKVANKFATLILYNHDHVNIN